MFERVRRPEDQAGQVVGGRVPMLGGVLAAGNRAVANALSVQRAPKHDSKEPFTPEQLSRMGQAAQVNVLFGDIEKLKNDRILTWRDTANAKEPKPLREALDIVVAMVALGIGGVFGTIIAKGIEGHLMNEFVLLAGLELGDKVIEDSYEHAMREAGESLRAGTLAAMPQTTKNVEAALAGDKDDLIGVYAEAMRLQIRAETSAQQEQFNLNAPDTYGAASLLLRRIALKLIYNQLFTQPQVFHRELTEGFIRLMDENHLAVEAQDYGGDKGRTWKEDTDLHDTDERKGNLLVLPEAVSTSLGNYGAPRLGFGNFYALATGANTKTLMKLAGTAVKDLPLSLGFRFWVDDPFYRIFKGGMVKAWFTRDPAGGIYLESGLGEGAMEWLASYYTGIERELTDEEREHNAPLGARKLYEAIKDKTITKITNSDVF
jgi:hypothetical protein